MVQQSHNITSVICKCPYFDIYCGSQGDFGQALRQSRLNTAMHFDGYSLSSRGYTEEKPQASDI